MEGENEPVAYNNNIIGNYSVDSFLVNFNSHTPPYLEHSVLSQVENFSQTDISKCVNFIDSHINKYLFWKLFFDDTKSNDGERAGCVLVSPEANKTMLTCRLVKYLQVFRDSEIVIRQVRKTIHCLSGHLKHCQSSTRSD